MPNRPTTGQQSQKMNPILAIATQAAAARRNVAGKLPKRKPAQQSNLRHD